MKCVQEIEVHFDRPQWLFINCGIKNSVAEAIFIIAWNYCGTLYGRCKSDKPKLLFLYLATLLFIILKMAKSPLMSLNDLRDVG